MGCYYCRIGSARLDGRVTPVVQLDSHGRLHGIPPNHRLTRHPWPSSPTHLPFPPPPAYPPPPTGRVRCVDTLVGPLQNVTITPTSVHVPSLDLALSVVRHEDNTGGHINLGISSGIVESGQPGQGGVVVQPGAYCCWLCLQGLGVWWC
jgi:hypothetical protein